MVVASRRRVVVAVILGGFHGSLVVMVALQWVVFWFCFDEFF